LVKLLLELRSTPHFRALVFTQRRLVCRSLYEFLTRSKILRDKCGLVMGEAGTSKADGYVQGFPSSQEVLKRFGEGKIEVRRLHSSSPVEREGGGNGQGLEGRKEG
jgi:ERCC4-related helicase